MRYAANQVIIPEMGESTSNTNIVIASAVDTFRSQKELAEQAIKQLSNEQLHKSLDPETNSIAVIMKHLAGNMRSRWTDFLTSDGEKTWRQRDNEFVDDGKSLEALKDNWDQGWSRLFETVSQLTEQDLGKIVKIRGKPHLVIRAIDREIAHYGYHVGQIVQIARILAQDKWQTISIPRGASEAYNRRTWESDE